jgi:predicted phosphodiesterase
MIAMLSDIHGNFPALVAVMNEIDRLGCRQVFSLGDVAGYYCMINECIGMLRERSIIHLLGNHDYYLIQDLPCPRSGKATACLEYQRKVVLKEHLRWLRSSKESLSYNNMSMVHGGWIDPIDEYLYEISEHYFSGLEGEIFLSGHTHVQKLFRFSEKSYCNPGSVGQPRDGDARASFAVITDDEIHLRRVGYDIDEIASRMEKSGFDSHFYSNLYQGARIGGLLSNVREESSRQV